MHALLLATIVVLAGFVPINAGPAPYTSAKIYILDPDDGLPEPPATADYIRKNAGIVISLDVYTVNFFASLNWDKHKHDPSIKDRAKPLVMIIDLYHRTQPESPAERTFDTLFCSSKYAYTVDGDFVNITPLTSKTLTLPVRR